MRPFSMVAVGFFGFSIIASHSVLSGPPTPTQIKAPKKEGKILIHSQPIKPIVIVPGPKQNATKTQKEPVFFELLQENRQLYLQITTTQPAYHLSQDHTFVVEITPSIKISVQPGLVTNKKWPKTSNKLPITVSRGQPGQWYHIAARAAYTYCHFQTKECKKAKSISYMTYKQLP